MTSQNSGTGREPARSCAECGTRAEPGQSFCDSCGAVLGWSGGPDRSDAARREPVRAEAAAPARDSAAGGAAVSGGSGGSGEQPGWDAFAAPGAGTGTARTGHDPAVAATPGAAGGRRGEDETGWPDAGAAGAGPSTGVRLARNAGPRPGDEGADHSADRPAGRAADGGAAAGRSGARRTDTAPDSESVAGLRRSGGADDSGAAAVHRQPGSADSSRSAAGHRQSDGSGGSGRAGTRQSSAASVGSGTAPDSPPRHDHPDTAPDSPSAASAGAGPAGLREWDTNSPAAPPSYGSLDLSSGGRDNAHPDARPDTHPGIHPDDDADTEPVPTTASRGHHPSPDSSDSTAERARSLLIPVSDPEPRAPAAPAVAPVLPGRPVANRPQVRAPGPEFGPQGGTPCPWCATLNLPDRHYCGRCAMPMAGGGPSAPGRQPWWRRIPGFGVAQTPWAGDRPRLRRGFGAVMNWVVGGVVLALIVTLVLTIGDGVDATRDHFAKRAAVGPDSVKASRSYSGHGASLAFDKLSNTWWGPGVSGNGEGQWLEARFDQPTRLLDLVITSGVSTQPDKLSQSALPHRIEALITAADGKKSTRIINLDQSAGGQRRKFRVGAVSSVRFTVKSAYATDAKKQVSIAEIEFFTRSNSNSS
ncbi:NADase-type glycan-binding domain-containing protein [Streptomyces phaeochromogenes]|uniref:NADase-type glycan-binding domain-containing protein n=1 Tax=Streptomyces phaeochromogenes TaxID=1923 RepID=UPI00386A87D3|nr:zinc ribbon domain-containing protein [Streptomyces phaeochromogenes]